MSTSVTPNPVNVPTPSTNVVPIARSTPTTPPAIPLAMPWPGGSSMPGCCPPGGMDALMKCYCDVQQAMAFFSQIMQSLMTTDPNVQAAMVAGLEKSGSNLPLIGVTNGSDAQPGQVGENVIYEAAVNYTAAAQNQNVTMGILQPGDWDFWMYAYCPNAITGVNISLYPIPQTGLSGQPQGFFITDVAGGVQQAVCLAPQCRLSITVPTLIVIECLTNQGQAGPAAGQLALFFNARRRR